MNWSNQIAADMQSRWGDDDVVIIEDWRRAGPAGDRYHVSDRNGGCFDFDVDAFAARGLLLTVDLVQEPFPEYGHSSSSSARSPAGAAGQWAFSAKTST